MSLSKFFNKKAKNDPIFKIQVSIHIRIKFEWGVKYLKNIKFWLFQKVETSQNKIVKFAVI